MVKTDLISRQAVIEINRSYHGQMPNEVNHRIWKEIKPERKTGRWISVTNGRGGHECDLCHNYAPAWQTGEEHLTDFCPNCGAYMREG